MLNNLLLGLPVMVLSLLLQTVLLVVIVRYYLNHRYVLDNGTIWPTLVLINVIMLLLVMGNLGQIAVWALLFQLLGEFDQFGLAFYHSAVNFGSLGYGDIVMSEEHRLLGALEAINGVLMIGVSTASLMTPFKNVLQLTMEKRND